MSIDVAISGTGTTKYGPSEKSPADLGQLAAKEAFEQAGLGPEDIDGLVLSTQNSEILQKQGNAVLRFAEFLGLDVKFGTRTEAACVAGTTALKTGHMAVKSGTVENCLVLGVEKCNELPSTKETISAFAFINERDFEAQLGANAMWHFAPYAVRHMYEFGTTEEQLAEIRAKNSRFSTKNPKAHFQKELTVEDVMNSPVVCKPLKLYDCCPISDGGSAAILTSAENAKEQVDVPIYAKGYGQSMIPADVISSIPDHTEFTALKKAAKRAYESAGIGPDDVDVVETHDCFTIAELLEIEALGFCEKGEGGKFVEDGQLELGGEIPTNTSGGLLCRGHPIGATGICQATIIADQLRQETPKGRQVDGATIGVNQNLGGPGTSQAVFVWERRQ
ncbi:hypothetical protein AKJ61_03165 [candidate division MSBL1 archaeon SCGC-AAA259B11]|uniref:Acetyl-CoA acetyltransferase n=1 Tax=candidate division MSBL1 archaeon SCGC-AAA259B11 TaxID=1698260 RepID=A0A133U551_9EURY|nr:hypothetical protein AKJ61_03165 [candidate division MSBL1 archaeon SCGC-AAA259B11]